MKSSFSLWLILISPYIFDPLCRRERQFSKSFYFYCNDCSTLSLASSSSEESKEARYMSVIFSES